MMTLKLNYIVRIYVAIHEVNYQSLDMVSLIVCKHFTIFFHCIQFNYLIWDEINRKIMKLYWLTEPWINNFLNERKLPGETWRKLQFFQHFETQVVYFMQGQIQISANSSKKQIKCSQLILVICFLIKTFWLTSN